MRKRTDTLFDTEMISFSPEKYSKKLDVHDLTNTFNAFETNDNVTSESKLKEDEEMKGFISTTKNTSSSNLKQKYKIFTGMIPSLKKFDRVLKHAPSK
jgi:hypothetical protein